MAGDEPSGRTRSWYTDPRVVTLLVHTALVVGGFALTYDPSHDIHIHPCIMMADIPGLVLWYYGGSMVVRVFNLPAGYHLTSAAMQVLGFTVTGGLQWCLIVWLVMAIRARERIRNGVCTRCGYDLTGNVSGQCPECGETVPPESARSN